MQYRGKTAFRHGRHEYCISVSFMKTKAVTFWNGIVSPVYDAAEEILIVSTEGKREILNVGRMSIFEKTEFLEENNVRVLICGAISNLACADLINKRIEVISWIRGDVDEVLQAHSRSILKEEPFLLPGCRDTCRCHGKPHKRKKNKRSFFSTATLTNVKDDTR
jgi:predicted Fe-Mo cluster-binding NifX family protein